MCVQCFNKIFNRVFGASGYLDGDTEDQYDLWDRYNKDGQAGENWVASSLLKTRHTLKIGRFLV